MHKTTPGIGSGFLQKFLQKLSQAFLLWSYRYQQKSQITMLLKLQCMYINVVYKLVYNYNKKCLQVRKGHTEVELML